MKKHLPLSLAFISLLFTSTYADQPVHCLKNEILGTWVFRATKDSFAVDLHYAKAVCTHLQPNRLQLVAEGASEFELSGETEEYEVELSEPNRAVIKRGLSNVEGTWTMLYDQGMIIESPELRFYANFKYTIKTDKQDEDSIKQLEESSYDAFNSICYQTMVGFVLHNSEESNQLTNRFGCFTGYKPGSKFITETSEQIQQDEEAQIVYSSISTKANTLSQVQYEQLMRPLVDYVNENNSTSWKAHVDERYAGLNMAQVRMHLKNGQKQSRAKNRLTQTNQIFEDHKDLNDPKYAQTMKKAQKYLNTPVEDMRDEDLPEEWDWRKVDGVDFTSPIRDQGGCGSCYTISFVTSVESRIKIATGKEVILSPQFLLSCNFFNEGCSGGWPLLNGFFTQIFSLPLESCAPYESSTHHSTCASFAHCPPAVDILSASYLGGYYGASSESLMMREIRARGPIVGDVNVPMGFSVYREGIFHDECEKGFQDKLLETGEVNDQTLADYNIEWELVNHSIVIVGWGVENGVKFWICRNSYGSRYGEDGGHFRVRRGQNDLGIESHPSSYTARLIDNFTQ
ncbi:hypothetical protein FGO68_gene13534 [Halteria grandinella]|uniref:Peptidase C1A papain C-terminal domain-containing protein n=1 Tax=Halteria grandinella TaxID=5974 RepID=A0A8J8T350_HALGN|nr:hypothetical protein FGO68_gene13534 [Halteria grandinella]